MSDHLSTINIKKTRKPHVCQWCPELIEIDTQATRINWTYEGSAFSEYWHPECAEVASSYADFDPHWEDFEPHQFMRGRDYNGD